MYDTTANSNIYCPFTAIKLDAKVEGVENVATRGLSFVETTATRLS